MKDRKAAGCSGILAEMIKASGEKGVGVFNELINFIIREEVISDEWHKSILYTVYEQRGLIG